MRRLDALEKMPPIVMTSELTAINDAAVLRTKAKGIYENLTPAGNARDTCQLRFPASGFKKMKSHSADPRIMQAVPVLRDIFAGAVHLYTEASRGANDFIVAWHTYATKTLLSGREAYVRLTAKELRNRDMELDFYDIHYAETKTGLNSSVREANPPRNDSDREIERYSDISTDILHRWMSVVKSQFNSVKTPARLCPLRAPAGGG